MRDFKLIYKKEAKDFFSRKSMLPRYALLLLINVLAVVYSDFGIPMPILSFCFMLFTTFGVVGITAVGVIGAEKKQKTYETLLSTPLPLSRVFYGMTAFMATVGLLFLLAATVLNNIWLPLLYHQSYLSILGGLPQLLVVYVVVLLSMLFLILASLIIMLFATNPKAGNFVTLAIAVVLIFGIYEFIAHYSAELSLIVIVGLLVLFGLLFVSIERHMNKQYALRFAK
ncbi:MAG: hypothetical protein FWC62_01760 [Firmicutes bacterium]|nr:hypothetical protein [Bacillota bacterium]